jgi:sugar phosphate isomerase/epimerase
MLQCLLVPQPADENAQRTREGPAMSSDSGWRLGVSAMTPRNAGIFDRFAALAAAGVHVCGISLKELSSAAKAGVSADDIRREATRHDIRLDSVEALYETFRPDTDGSTARFLDTVFGLAEQVGASRITAIGDVSRRWDLDQAAKRFGQVCRLAAQANVDVLLEFVPWTTLPTLSAAARVVDRAGEANGGIVLDAWHFFRGGSQLRDVAAVTAGAVREFQVTDGMLRPQADDPYEDTMRHRMLPGTGEFALRDLLAAIGHRHGNVPVTIEIFSEQLSRLDPSAAVAAMVAATRNLLGSVPAPG